MFLFISMRCRKLEIFEIKVTRANGGADFFLNFSSKWVYLIQPSVEFHIGTGHLFCSAKYMAGFYMKWSTGLKQVEGEIPFPEVEEQPVSNLLVQLFLVTLCCDTYWGKVFQIFSFRNILKSVLGHWQASPSLMVQEIGNYSIW